MAKKVYLVDSTGYEFFICEFEGMGSDNRPRLTIMTPGRPVENFLTHLDYYGEDPKDYYRIAKDKAVTLGHIKRGELDKAKVIIPDIDSLVKIDALMEPIFNQIISNELESRRLAELRDALLPRLMSGEIKVLHTDLINEMLDKGIR